MFDVGFTEIMLIGVVALVVIGPERLPDVARTVGAHIGKVQRFVTGVKRDFKKELEAGELKKLIGDQKDQIDELRKIVDTTRQDFSKSASEITGDAKERFAEIQAAAGHGSQETPVDATAADTKWSSSDAAVTDASAVEGRATGGPAIDETVIDNTRADGPPKRAAGADDGS